MTTNLARTDRRPADTALRRPLIRSALGFASLIAAFTPTPNLGPAALPRHLIRGTAGFGALVGAFVLTPILGPAALLLAPIGLVALRGCPACWLAGLSAAIAADRSRAECADGRCVVVPVEPATGRPGADEIVRRGTGTR